MTIMRVVRPDRLVRARRLDVLKGVVVESKTIGTSMSYPMETENLSRTGLLLNVARNSKLKVPFRVNTIIEMTVDPDTALFERPISCLGKVVRLADEDGAEGPSYGVHIVQIDGRDLDVWERCVGALEEKQLASALPAAS